MCNRVLFSLNKDFFQYCEQTSFGGKKSFFFEIPDFLRIFRSGVVGATDPLVAEHVANMLS